MKPAAALPLAALFSASAAAFEISHPVDGDSIQGANAEQARLLCIDAPEYKQPGGIAAHQALARLLQGAPADIRIKKRGTDKHDRHLVLLTRADGTSINLEMIRQGYAWVLRRYMHTCGIPVKKLNAAEAEARRKKRGLWNLPNPQPPWEWRRQNPR